MFCDQPFNRVEIYENGDVYNCCPPYISNYCIGNIFESKFEDIWNGEKVKELRQKILASDYSYCLDFCNRKNNNDSNDRNYGEVVLEFPEDISISSDRSCNVRCTICRDEHWNIPYKKENLADEIKNVWLPIFKNAQLLRFGCSGEPFASYKEKMIIKMAAETYPQLKFHFHTNGILGDKKMLENLGVYNRISTITVSLHSANLFTYNKIVRGGNYYKVMSNLKLYAAMKEKGLVQNLRMIFVVFKDNYKDSPSFVRLAQKHHATAEFWALKQYNDCQVCKNFKEYSLLNSQHKDYQKFIKILQQDIFDADNVILYPELKQLRVK